MPDNREILKIGLVVTDSNRLLLVRKKGSSTYILPGGKPEDGEDDIATLERELNEELGCRLNISTVAFLGSFSDVAADQSDVRVTVRAYCGYLIGDPCPHSEIETLKWFSPYLDNVNTLAPSLKNQIVPFLMTSDWSKITTAKNVQFSTIKEFQKKPSST